jgi:hypothetical protein
VTLVVGYAKYDFSILFFNLTVCSYTPDYPNSSAFVHLENSQGLNEKQFNELALLVSRQNEIHTNQEKVFDLTQVFSFSFSF